MRAQPTGTIASWFAAVLWSGTALAAVCLVPSGSHPTIQAAVDDPTCTEVVLAAQVFVESVTVDRSLQLRGARSAATTVEGRVVVEGATTQVQLGQMTVDAGAPSVAGCYGEALESSGGARVSGSDLKVRNADGDGCLLFRDGFESGGTTAWSTTVP
jgi:hypothetical protein